MANQKRSGTYVQQLTGYEAFIPTPLPPNPPLHIDEDTTQKLKQATVLLARLDGQAQVLQNRDLFISMYVKKEALLSTQIEGTQASLTDVLEFEGGIPIDNVNEVADVINYIKALKYGIKRLETLPMSLRLIKELHAIILEGTRGKEKTPGEFKRSQNWIGPSSSRLQDAIFVPPPPHETLQAMADFEKYLHADSLYSEIINCALLHYQFETIHPFLDGNGRLGRLLIPLYLYWKGTMNQPLLYMSYYLKKNRQEYYDRLMLVRNKGYYEQWVNFFLDGIIQTCESAQSIMERIGTLRKAHIHLIRAHDLPLKATTLLDELFNTPIITITDIQEKLKVSYPTAANITKQMTAIGILKEITGQKRAKRFTYHEYLAIISEGTSPLKM